MADGDANALLLSISADNSKLIKSLDQVTKRLNGLPNEWGSAGKKAAHELEKSTGSFTGEGFGKALGKVFDSSKLAVLEEGSAKLRIFGSALEPLGPLGIGAAAGVAALGAALEEAHKAVEFADELFKLAKNAHVTTDELQQMQYALRVSGGNAADASGALQAFSSTLGKAQAGLPKAQKAFLELGFTKAQIKGFDDAGTALDAVVEKIAGLKSTAQKDAVIDQLGLTQMKPLIEAGAEKMREFKEEAVASGNVMDEHLVKRGHELNEQIETAAGKVKVQLAEAFVNIGPVLVKLLGYLADMAGFAEKISAAFSPIEARGTTDLQRELRGMQARQQQGGIEGAFYKSSDQANIPRIQAELAKRAAEKPEGPPTGTGTLTDVSHHTTPHDQTLDFNKSANDAYESGFKALIEAQKALTGDIDARAALEKQAIASELAKKTNDQKTGSLDVEEAKIKASQHDANKKVQLALIEQARTEEQAAAQAKTDLIDRQARYAREDQLDATRKALADAVIAQMESAAASATTAAERAQIERDILKLRQDEYTHELGKTLSRGVESGEITDEVAAQRSDARRITQAAERANLARSQENPIEKFQRSVQDFATTAQQAGVNAMESLSNGLADAIANAHSLGDVARNVFRQMITELLAAAIKKDIAAPLLAFIPGFASGTSYAPGGMALVGEQGPELVNLPRGASVTPTNQTMSALKNMRAPTAAGPTIVQQSFYNDNRGAVMTEDLLRAMDAKAAAAERNAVAKSLSLGKRQLPDALRQHQQLRG